MEQAQQAAAAREMELQTEFESLSNEMMERIEQLQEEVAGLLEFKQHKVSTEAALRRLHSCHCSCHRADWRPCTRHSVLHAGAVIAGRC
jgi:hypothetical protein